MIQAVNNNAGGVGGAGGAGASAPPQCLTELNYSVDDNYVKALNFQNFKERMSTTRVMHMQTGQSLLKDFKNARVNDLISEFHMQYIFVVQTKIIASGMPMERYNNGIFNVHYAHYPFNSFKRWIVLPVLARYGGVFSPGTMAEGLNINQAAEN